MLKYSNSRFPERETSDTARRPSRCWAPAAFTSLCLGFSAAKLVLPTGPGLGYKQQNNPSQAALLLCRAGVLPCPAWWHVQVPCKLSPSALAESLHHLLPVSIASSGAATKAAERDPGRQLACGPNVQGLCSSSAQPLLCRRN